MSGLTASPTPPQDGDSGAYACVICGNVLLGYVSIAQGLDSDGQELYRGSRRTVTPTT